MNPLAWPGNHLTATKIVIFSLASLPSLEIVVLYRQPLEVVNPFAALMGLSGSWSLNFLLLTLLVTPLRRWASSTCRIFHTGYGKRLGDWNWLVKCRRMLGLFCFAYATIHLGFYLWLEMDFLLDEVIYDLKERKFVLVGLTAFLLLVPLAITSLDWFRKTMGMQWRRLHRLTYAVAILGAMHFVMLGKMGNDKPIYYSLMFGVLLGYRLLVYFEIVSRFPKDYGMEVSRNTSN